MAKYFINYTGQLRTSSIHLQSGNELITDAPKDNHGRGETFSPTDLTAISLATCIITVMGIKAQQMDLPELEIKAEVEKIMQSEPRRIAKVVVKLFVKNQDWNNKTKVILEKTGINCPVAHSLHPDLQQEITFNYSN